MFEDFYVRKINLPTQSGVKLRKIRLRKNKTVKDISNACNVTEASIRYYENCERQLTDERLKEIAAGYEEEEDDYVNEVYHDWSFSKLYETDDYVTFMGYTELYEGGIHGISYENGVTFFDGGQRFSKEMLRNIDGEKFQKLMRKGLKDFFSKNPDNMTDEELGEELINVEDVYNIPMPDAEPYITEDGVTFIYQPYEISYYAAGKPEFSVPLTKMRPFLTKKALRLLDMDEEDED